MSTTLDVEVNGKMVASKDNGVARALEGIPDEPKGTTEEMKKVATAVIEGLMSQRCISGWFGDRTDAFKRDEINNQLKYFVDYQETKLRSLHINYVISHTRNLEKYVSPDILDKYAKFLGYQLNRAWVDWQTPLDGEQYPRFYIRSVSYIGERGQPYAELPTQEKDPAEIAAAVIGGYGDRAQNAFEINCYVKDFEEYRKTKVSLPVHKSCLASITHNMRKIVSPDVLNRFAELLGYQLVWQHVTWKPHVPGEYPQFDIKCIRST